MLHIAFAPDDNYVLPTSVALTSLLTNEKESLTIYIIYIENNLSNHNKNILKKLVEKYNQSIIFKEVSLSLLSSFPKFRHGYSSYLRIFTPILFPHLDKILYIDGDVIIEKSIKTLYDIDISGYELAAVSDLKQFFAPGYVESIGYTHHRLYFNAGILLMNLKKLRAENIQHKTEEYLSCYKNIIYHEDQDILNCVCPNVLSLPPKYNSIIHLWNNNRFICKRLWNEIEIKEATTNPTIIHYLGGIKPWKLEVYHPFKSRWYYYLKKSPFKSYKPQFTIKKVLSYIKSYIIYLYKRNINKM